MLLLALLRLKVANAERVQCPFPAGDQGPSHPPRLPWLRFQRHWCAFGAMRTAHWHSKGVALVRLVGTWPRTFCTTHPSHRHTALHTWIRPGWPVLSMRLAKFTVLPQTSNMGVLPCNTPAVMGPAAIPYRMMHRAFLATASAFSLAMVVFSLGNVGLSFGPSGASIDS